MCNLVHVVELAKMICIYNAWYPGVTSSWKLAHHFFTKPLITKLLLISYNQNNCWLNSGLLYKSLNHWLNSRCTKMCLRRVLVATENLYAAEGQKYMQDNDVSLGLFTCFLLYLQIGYCKNYIILSSLLIIIREPNDLSL